MGKRALISHANGKKHKATESVRNKSVGEHMPLNRHWNNASRPCLENQGHHPCSSKEVQSSEPLLHEAPPTISSFLAKDAALEAEILWSIKTVVDHYSCNSSEKTNLLFARMFSDSDIAKKFSCGKTKCGYLIKFGLAPYFHQIVLSELSDPKLTCLYSVSFDESFNKTIQEEQMDLIVRFWDKERQMVSSRYFGSEFLGHTRASDLLEKFLHGSQSLNQGNMVQVSMDGPSTNWKFYEDLVQHREAEELPAMINIGSCSLHVIHGAFKSGAQSSGWNIDGVLRALHYLFRDAPARAADYTEISGSKELPKRFCSTRWLEDTAVAERAISIWPNVKKYVTETLRLPKNKIPKIQSFEIVTQAVNDVLFPAKLQFFITQASLLSSYLEIYQTEKPMSVFIAGDLKKLLQTLLGKFLKKSVIDGLSAAQLCKIDLDNADNVLPVMKTDIGFATRAILEKIEKNKNVSDLRLMAFFAECGTFLKEIAKKMMVKSPLKYPIIGHLTSLDPRNMAKNDASSSGKFQKLLSKLLSLKRLSAEECDASKQQFEDLLKEIKAFYINESSNFDPKSQRLDSFFADLLEGKDSFAILWKVIKMVLVLSHGQADVERGFSVNKDVVAFNMDPDTLCAYRKVYDAVKHLQCEVHEIIIGKEMLKSCKASHQRYLMHIEEQKQKKKSNETCQKIKAQETEIMEMKKKIVRLEADSEHLMTKADKLCEEAEAKNKISLVTESNALRAKSKLKRKEWETAKEEVKVAEEALKKLKS